MRTLESLARFTSVLAIPAAAVAAAPRPAPVRGSSDSPVFRGDARHSGVSDSAAGPALAGVAWKFATKGPVRGAAALAGDLVLFGSGDGNLYAVDAANGTERWRADLEGAVASTPAVADGLVVATSRERRITAVDLASGKVRWRFEAGSDLPFAWGWDFWLSSPVVAGGRVYVGSGDGKIYALDARTGKKAWEFATGGRVRSSPAFADGVVYAGSMDGRLYALDAATGISRWAFETEGFSIDSAKAGFDRTSIVSSPAVAADLVFVGSRDAHLYAVSRRDGARKWRFAHPVERMPGSPEVSWVLSSPALYEGLVLTGSSDGRFFDALRAESGEEVWRFKTPGNVLSSGTVAGGQIFFGGEEGHVFALDAATGRERWRFRTAGAVISTPVVGAGRVYVGSDDGNFYALATGPTPAGTRDRRAVYWRDAGGHKWFRGDVAVRDWFRDEGYEVLDDAGLAKFLGDPEAAPRSLLIVSGDALSPDATAGDPPATPFRRFLAAGGRVVWLGVPPGALRLDPKTGATAGVDFDGVARLLGVRQAGTFDWMGATATADGKRWGLPDWYVGGFCVDADQVTTVLGRDEYGRASAWIKTFSAVPGSGLVRLWGRETEIPDLSWVQRVAEHPGG